MSSAAKNQATMLPAVDAVSKYFGMQQVLNNVSLSLRKGGITCLLGPSGCGKSTLLRIAAGLLKPDAGRVHLDPRECAMVFQEPRLLPWLTVAENLALALYKGPAAEKRQAVSTALKLVELGSIEEQLPRELSGGMAQRVGLARALLRSPSFLLMDEPFAALDAITRGVLQKMLVTLIDQRGISCLFVTHDIQEALLIADHIAVMQSGRIVMQYSVSTRPAFFYSEETSAHRSERDHIKEQILVHLQQTVLHTEEQL